MNVVVQHLARVSDEALKTPGYLARSPECPGRGIAVPLAFGTLWVFEEEGDRVPMHQHPEPSHFTVFIRGRVLYREGDTETEYLSGDVIRTKANVDHSFTALTAGAVLVNVRDHG